MSHTYPIPVGSARKLEVDLSRYAPLFDDEGVSDADKMALMEALWSIMMSFAQMGWGVHPVQQARMSRQIRELACGQQAEPADPGHESVLDSSLPALAGRFEGAAEDDAREARGS